jgi:hypothetical protein
VIIASASASWFQIPAHQGVRFLRYHVFSPNEGSPNEGSPNKGSPNKGSPNKGSPKNQ